MELDRSQQLFVNNPNGNIRLLAPAGAGKTSVLLWRCLHLYQKGLTYGRVRRFLILTFSKGASEELRRKLNENPDLSEVSRFINISTMNSYGYEIINKERKLHIISGDESKHKCIHYYLDDILNKPEYVEIKQIVKSSSNRKWSTLALFDLLDSLKSMGFRYEQRRTYKDFEKRYHSLVEKGLESLFEKFHDRLQELGIVENPAIDLEEIYKKFVLFWKEACNHLVEAGQITFEDQKHLAWLELRNQYMERDYSKQPTEYDYIFVDEFQDINPLDALLVNALTAVNKACLCIVGDDDQAIYEWRGATPEFILNPDENIGAKFVNCSLEINYRSPRNIVMLSQKLIANNKKRIPKTTRPKLEKDADIHILHYPVVSEAIQETSNLVERLMGQYPSDTIALISRKRSQIVPYQIIFAGRDIPFYAAEDLNILLSRAFKELKELVRIKADICSAWNQEEHLPIKIVEDLLTLCNKVYKHQLSSDDMDDLTDYLMKNPPKNLLLAVLSLNRYEGQLKIMERSPNALNKMADAVFEFIYAKTASETIRTINRRFEGFQRNYGKSIDDLFYTDPPFFYIEEMADCFDSDFASFNKYLDAAIEKIERYSLTDSDEGYDDRDSKSLLHLMTSIRAKGKEFDTVIVLDANESIWPSKLAGPDELEQERRLFYVAVTRTRKRLFFVVNKVINGVVVEPTPYLEEMGLI